MTTFTVVASAREERFCIIERLDGYGRKAALGGEFLRVAARLAANEEGHFLEFLFRFGGPVDDDAADDRRGGERLLAAEMRRRRAVMELDVVAEHGDEMLLETHHQRMDPGV